MNRWLELYGQAVGIGVIALFVAMLWVKVEKLAGRK